MKQKKKFLIFLVGLYAVLPFILLRSSPTEHVIWRWSNLHALIVVIYAGLVILSTGIFFAFDKIGGRLAAVWICVYFLAIFIGDFIIGTCNFYSHQLVREHPVYHHRLGIGTFRCALTDTKLFDHTYAVKINNQGLRSDRGIPYRKPEGTYRILVLGDSFTEGIGVNNDETFCSLIEEQLNSGKENRLRYEVLNAGVESYVPMIENLYLMREGINFSPDFVIVFLDMGDLMQTETYFRLAYFDANGKLLGIRPNRLNWKGKLEVFVRSRFYFVSILYYVLQNEIAGRPSGREALLNQVDSELFRFSLFADQSPWKEQWQRLFSDIEEMARFCSERNIGFAVAVYPLGHQVSGQEWDIGRRGYGLPENYTAPPDVFTMITGELGRRGINVLDLLPAFRAYRGGKRLYFRNDAHWTKEGHVVVAQAAAPFLKEKISGSGE